MKILDGNSKSFNYRLDQILFKRKNQIQSDRVSVTNIINDVKKK